MEPLPATTQDPHLAAPEPVPIAGAQMLNDRGQRDRTRDQRDKPCRKRLKVLDNPNKLAFRGWIDVPEPWTFEQCKQYIEWCHVGKGFKRDRYLAHRSANKANLKFCENPNFLERCIQVYQYLFCKEKVVRNEVNYKICYMIWVEVGLQRRIDWRSYGAETGVTLPPGENIPRTRTYPNGGLGVLRTATAPPPTYDIEESNEDSDFDGANPPFLSTSPTAIRSRQLRARKRARDGLSSPDQNVAAHGTMAEPPVPSISVIRRALDFEGPRTGHHEVSEVGSHVQPPPTATTGPVDPMDIIQDAPNCSGARPITAIGEDTEQATAQNPPRPAPEIREVGTEAIRLVQHLTGMVERSDALNHRNQYKLNLLQRKVDERNQLIVQKDATIAEKDGAINTYLSTIASFIQQIAELCLVRSTEERNATESAPHSDAALDTLVAYLTDSIVDPAVTPPRPASRQRLTSLLDNPAGPSRTVQDSQDSLSFPSIALGLPITEMAAWTANVQASTHVEEMVKLQEENAKLKEELQTLQSNHDKLDCESAI